jgi:hypothetical protein
VEVKGMELKRFKATWGMEGTYEAMFNTIADAGYEGVEMGVPPVEDRKLVTSLLQKYNLTLILMIFTVRDGDVIGSFAEQLKEAAAMKPLLINAHSARDSMLFTDQVEFYSKAVELEKSIGVSVGHETHRSRAMFTPWNTAALLQAVPDLQLVADFSHWCCVCESLLEDQRDALELAISRTLHIHGRVGYAQGPQVTHPHAPEWEQERIKHVEWWIEICKSRQKRGFSQTTFTPEFGPSPYMHALPFTNEPVANLWEVCSWMSDHFQSVYNQSFNKL